MNEIIMTEKDNEFLENYYSVLKRIAGQLECDVDLTYYAVNDLLRQRDELLEACLRARIAIHVLLKCGTIRRYEDDEMAVNELLDAAIADATKEADSG